MESIASQVGYSDVTAFVRGFRRAHGMTPRAWRESHRQAGRLEPVNFHRNGGAGIRQAPRA